VGMYPNTGVSPIDLSHFPVLEGILDLIYNPAKTQLLLDAEKRGIVAMNGLWMLVAQAKEASEWFSDQQVSDEKIAQIHTKLRAQMENIVLIGMPGCGKSTVGKALADKYGKQFTDADALIEEMAGKPIPEIFAKDGEEVFREWETKALEYLGKQSGLVIATGGGCVTKQRNYPLLHQNGQIIWLQRSLELLPSDGRPLSQTHKMIDMYAVRKGMYAQFADQIIDNNGSISDTLEQIGELL